MRAERGLLVLVWCLPLGPLLGQLSSVVAAVQFFLVGCAVPVLGLLVVVTAFKAPRRAWLLIPLAITFALNAWLTMGVPIYLQRDTAPLLARLEAWRRAHPDEPVGEVSRDPALRELLRGTGCFNYRPEPQGEFGVTCSGVGFTKCSYSSRTRAWHAWD